MNALQISRLTIRDSPEGLVQLPPPEASPLATAKKADLLRVARAFWPQLRDLVTGAEDLSGIAVRSEPRRHGRAPTLEGAKLRHRLLLALGGYYDYALRGFVGSPPGKRPRPLPGVNQAALEAVSRVDPHVTATPHQQWTRELVRRYIACLIAVRILTTFRESGLPDALGATVSIAEQMGHTSLLCLHILQGGIPGGPLGSLATRFLRSCLHYMHGIYEARDHTWNPEHFPGPFSHIRLAELSLLAKRDEGAVKKYGRKRVEKVFEHQLALIAQSFGFYVVGTRTGRRTVDLICVSGDPREPSTILIEAKTTKGAYSLPAADERALRDYVGDVRHALTTLPPLKLALLVGHRAAGTLAAKLRRLEGTVQLPLRFCAAQDLARLRESLPGPAPLGTLIRELLAAPHVLQKDFVPAVVRSYHSIQHAHSALVDALLPSRAEGPGTRSPWAERLSREDA